MPSNLEDVKVALIERARPTPMAKGTNSFRRLRKQAFRERQRASFGGWPTSPGLA